MAKQKLKLLRATLPPFETDLNGLPSNSSAECSQALIACLTTEERQRCESDYLAAEVRNHPPPLTFLNVRDPKLASSRRKAHPTNNARTA